MVSGCQRYVRLSGSSFEIGTAHGCALADLIRAQVRAVRATLALQGGIDRYGAWMSDALSILERELPDVFDELRGLAVGAGVSLYDIATLQYRRELHANAPDITGCTTWASGSDHPVLVQTIDLEPEMVAYGATLCVTRSSKQQALICTFAGLPGFCGINSDGLALGLNFVRSGGWRPGVSPYLIARHLLGCSSVEEAVHEIRRLTRSSSRVFVLVDHAGVTMVETTPRRVAITAAPALARANHYVHPDLVEADELNIFSRNASVRRQARLQELAEAIPSSKCAESFFGILADHSLWPAGLCAHASAGARDDTVGAVVLFPTTGELHVRRGHVCDASTLTYVLGTSVQNNVGMKRA